METVINSYREIAPAPRWAETIECFWTMEDASALAPHRVTPDGCADIIFSRNGSAIELNVIGAMTTYRDFSFPVGQSLTGARFRPGKWTGHLGVPGDRITDALLPLEDLWGARARRLTERLAEASSLDQSGRVFEALLEAREQTSPVQRAIAWMERHRGCVSLDEVAAQCGISPRQFRRVCLEQTGLTPKFLARVLRFRHALSRLRESPSVELALDCGYYDQAHFINEFRTFAGRSPGSRDA